MLKRNEETYEEISGEQKQRTINSREFLQTNKKKKVENIAIEIKELKEKNHITPDTQTHTKYLVDYRAKQEHVK